MIVRPLGETAREMICAGVIRHPPKDGFAKTGAGAQIAGVVERLGVKERGGVIRHRQELTAVLAECPPGRRRQPHGGPRRRQFVQQN